MTSFLPTTPPAPGIPDCGIKWVTPLELRGVPGQEEFELLADLIVQVDGIEYRAPAGMHSDGMSAGRLLWAFEGHPWAGTYRYASVMHDAAYRGYLSWRPVGEAEWTDEPLTRAEADALFRRLVAYEQAIRCQGISSRWQWWQRTRNVVNRWKKWCGLRIGGAGSYKPQRGKA